MPRPGPRPYECVRRAWHSDRHQPIRGSLIQEIFRVANEVHNPETRKNKEWQEKLPLVVLKAEEIMYSKANSEVEYMDLKTLWERANDAIDTIIRRDDTPEAEGDLLQPCIEAALNLGCIPRRASRSQRHNNPSCYLSSTTREATTTTTASASFKCLNNNNGPYHIGISSPLVLPQPLSLPPPPPPPHQPHPISPQSYHSQFTLWYPDLPTPTNINHSNLGIQSVIPDASCEPSDYLCVSNNTIALSVPVVTYPSQSLGRVYPLHYSDEHSKVNSHLRPLNPQDPMNNTDTASMPCLPSVCGKGTSLLHNFMGSNIARDGSNPSSNFEEVFDNPPHSGCDLSLRLGLSLPPSLDAESVWTREVEDVGSSSSCDGSKFSDSSPTRTRAIKFESSFSSSKDKGFDFFPVDTTDEPLESCSSKWSSEEEGDATREGF